jgi:O-phosphoseryl-tRNA(Cys) synthetase
MVIQAIQTCDVSFNEAQRAQTTVALRSQKTNGWMIKIERMLHDVINIGPIFE